LNITIITILVTFLAVVALTTIWTAYKKEEDEKKIKEATNKISSYIFYGVILLFVTVTFVFS